MKLLWFVGILISLLLGTLAYMMADNQPPYTYDLEKSYIVPARAKDGDQIAVRWRLKNINRICPGSNRRMLFDPQTKVILAAYDPTPAAVADSIKDGYLNRTFMLPKSMQSGRIGYRANVCYECNLYQKYVKPLCVMTPDLFFEIVE